MVHYAAPCQRLHFHLCSRCLSVLQCQGMTEEDVDVDVHAGAAE